MNCWEEKDYGSDIDGNRGVSMVFWELDDSEDEREEITLALYDDFVAGDSEGVKTVSLNCECLGDTVEEKVSIEDYLEELIAMAKDDSDYKTDADFKKYIDEVELEKCVRDIENKAKREANKNG